MSCASFIALASAPPKASAAHFAANCQAYGYQPGMAEMTRCIHDSADAGRVRAQQSAAYTSEAFARAGQAVQGRAQTATSNRISCQSYASGSYMTINCQLPLRGSALCCTAS